MRDIRSPKSSGSSKFPLPPEGNDKDASKELFEISASQKSEEIKPPSLDKKPSKPDKTANPVPQKKTPAFTSFEPKKPELKKDPAPIPRPEPKPKKITGSSVPVTNVHLPDDDLATHSDADHAPQKPVRPLFAATPVNKKPSKTKSRIGHKERKVVVGIFALLILAVLLAGFMFLPKAEVKLVLRNAPLLVDEKLTIRAQGTNAPDVIPGTSFFREIRIEGETNVDSTEVIGTKAGGVVQIVNRTLEEQAIKEQSRLVTEDGTLFYMQRHAIVPPATANSPSRVNVEVIAAEDGPQGNIKPQRLNFAALNSSAQSVVYAEATRELTGGTGESVLVIKEADMEKARDEAKEQAKKKAEQEIRGELPKDWLILEESWHTEVTSFETEQEIGNQTDKISFTASITVHVMGYEEKKLEETLRTALENRMDDNFMLFPGPISFTQSIDSVDWEKAEAVFDARVTHTTIPQLSLETLRERIAGRSQAEAMTYLEGLPGVHEVNIELWPFWVDSIPRIEQRVTVDIEPERKP